MVAWGRGKESWSVDYRVIEGDTARAEVWAMLDVVLPRLAACLGHTLPIRVMCVDAGYATQDVYAWVRQHPRASWGPTGAAARQPRTAVAVKGRDRDTALLLSVSHRCRQPAARASGVVVGTPVAKGELYRWLKLEWPASCWPTASLLEAGEASEARAGFPTRRLPLPQYGEEYFKQLTAERLVTRIVKGFPRASWEKEPGRRNEALDCRVYSRAAAAIYGLDRFDERHWRELERQLRPRQPSTGPQRATGRNQASTGAPPADAPAVGSRLRRGLGPRRRRFKSWWDERSTPTGATPSSQRTSFARWCYRRVQPRPAAGLPGAARDQRAIAPGDRVRGRGGRDLRRVGIDAVYTPAGGGAGPGAGDRPPSRHDRRLRRDPHPRRDGGKWSTVLLPV